MQPARPPNPNAGAVRAAMAAAGIDLAGAPGAGPVHSRGTMADILDPHANDDPEAAAAKVTKARSILVADYPWFGTLATRLHARPAPFIGTLGTDGTRLLYAPAFVNKQNMAELLGGIAHEVMHCGLLHPFRFNAHDHGEWNIACDYAINGILLDAGFVLPKGSLFDPKYRNMSAEQIYARRAADRANEPPPPPEPPRPGGEPGGEEGEPGEQDDDNDEPGGEQGEPQDGDTEPADDDQDGEQGDDEPDGDTPTDEPAEEDGDDAEEDGEPGEEPGEPTEPKADAPVRPGRQQEPKDDTGRMLPAPPKTPNPGEPGEPGDTPEPGAGWDESDWMVATAQATMLANKAGKSPGGAIRAAEAVREPVADWREILRRFIDQATSRDQSWTTPNRRYIAGGLYLPGNTPTDAPRLGVLVDTSGSINRDCLNQFASELEGIMREVRPEAVDVVYCDSAVAHVQEFTPDGGPMVLEPRGGGGTDMEPGFAWFDQRAEEGAPVCAVVCFTDLDFWSLPQEPDGYPVLWVCYPWVTQTAPWGETVRLSA